MLSTPLTYSGESLVEQLRWIEWQLDDAIAASGIETPWLAPLGGEEFRWNGSLVARSDILAPCYPAVVDKEDGYLKES
ncbi:hypothetical protein AUL38_04185 [Leucobacter sp. G161]|nr:hypothetical protein AUL38_04185 [Leucobacter sp. G161]